jgi:DNA polymerase-1
MKIELEYRDLSKTSVNYLEGVYSRLEENRIHTHFDIAGTGTSRLSSSNPNLQNVPKPLRIIYIADKGNVYIDGDFSQVELRVLAIIANEQTMLRELADGQNPYHNIAWEAYHKRWRNLSEEQHNRAKAVVLGTAYGRSPRSIALEFGIPTLLAEQWQDMCITKYPGLLSYKTKQRDLFLEGGKCVTPFGRERLVQRLAQAFNTDIQSSAGDMMKKTLIAMDNVGLDPRLTLHDSITIQAPKKRVKEAVREFREIMERPTKELGNYCFPCKIGVGENWYELKEV